jgi:hypothetical protein
MPTVIKIGPYRFHFYSDEGREPVHIHVATDEAECKFWLNPINLARNRGMKPHQIREIEKLIYEKKELIISKFHEFHNR